MKSVKPIIVLFKESITGIGSWNGQYTGSREACYTIHHENNPDKIKWFISVCGEGENNGRSYFYNFGDGYSSSCRISIIDKKKYNEIRKKDYTPVRKFFVDDILKYGYIRERSERHKHERIEKIQNQSETILVLLGELRKEVKFKPMPEFQENCPKAKLINKVDKLLNDLEWEKSKN